MTPKRYRKKPVVIEAMHFDHPSVGSRVAEWCGGSNALSPEQMTASLGDYVIRGVAGEFYPCKAGIFEATYEDAS